MLKYAFSLIFCASIILASGQKRTVSFSFDSAPDLPKYFYKKHLVNSPELWSVERQKALLLLAAEGYFTAQIQDSLAANSTMAKGILGQKYEGISVYFAETLRPLLGGLSNDGKTTYKNPVDYANSMKTLIAQFHNNGYPFASFQFERLELEEKMLTLSVSVDKGPYTVWKEVILKGDSSLSTKTLVRMLDLPIDSPFSLEKLKEVEVKLNQQSFIEILKPAEIAFEQGEATLFVYLKSSKSSSFSGALGLQPDPISQKVGLTGDLQLRLMNALHRAEQFEFNWRSIKPATQSLNLRFSYPYLFNTLLGADLTFQLYKRDSTFLEMKTRVGVQYPFASHWLAKAMYSFSGNNRLYAAASNSQFPKVASLRNSMYGLGLSYRKLDYLPNPRKGFIFTWEGFVGQRKVLSDSNALSTTAKATCSLEHFLPLSRRWVFHYKLAFDTYYAPTIYSNECFRFGGLATQRGFNEENFLSTTKATSQLELRYLLDRNSCVFVFYDQSMYENTGGTNYAQDRPFGFGVGTNLSSKAGIFSLVYGLGIEQHNPIDLRSGKIHFGYIAYF